MMAKFDHADEAQKHDDMVIIGSDYLDIDWVRKQGYGVDGLQDQIQIRERILRDLVGTLYPSILRREIEMLKVMVTMAQHQHWKTVK
jgi:hypothetical protein